MRESTECVVAVGVPDTKQVAAARGEHAANLMIGPVFVREKHHTELTDDSVECAIWEWEGGRIGGPELHLFAWLKLCTRDLKHWRVEIRCRQMSSCIQKAAQLAGDNSSPCGGLQHAPDYYRPPGEPCRSRNRRRSSVPRRGRSAGGYRR